MNGASAIVTRLRTRRSVSVTITRRSGGVLGDPVAEGPVLLDDLDED